MFFLFLIDSRLRQLTAGFPLMWNECAHWHYRVHLEIKLINRLIRLAVAVSSITAVSLEDEMLSEWYTMQSLLQTTYRLRVGTSRVHTASRRCDACPLYPVDFCSWQLTILHGDSIKLFSFVIVSFIRCRSKLVKSRDFITRAMKSLHI